MRSLQLSIFILVFLAAQISVRADLLDQLGLGKKKDTNQISTISTGALSQDQMVAGLKQALGKGVQKAIAQLGQTNGFLTNANVRIPMPAKLQSIEKGLRAMKQDKYADDFVNTNRAAEQAVPVASSVFADAVQQMSIADAKTVLVGTNTAATEYFRKVTQTNLFARFQPIVKAATEQTGVTSAYKKLMEKASGLPSSSGTLGAIGKTLSATGYLNQDTMDVDAYVTQKAMDGLFKMVAEEEKRIRENPAARSTELLQNVFGAVTK